MQAKQNWEFLTLHPSFIQAIKLFIGFMAMIVLGLYIYAFFFFPINTDAGFYLSTAEQWLRGEALYKDIRMRYTPMGIYLLGLNNLWTSKPQYGDYLIIVYIFNLLNALWVYLLARKLELTKLVALAAATITWGLFFKYEAYYIVLEPFVLFFLLIATYFSLLATRSDRLWIPIGVCVAFAFLSKQYALAILPSVFFWMYKMAGWKYLWKIIAFFSIGFISPIAFFLMHYWVVNDLAPSETFQIWFSTGGYGNHDWQKMLSSIGIFFILSVPSILTLPLTYKKGEPKIGLKKGGGKNVFIVIMWMHDAAFVFPTIRALFPPTYSICSFAGGLFIKVSREVQKVDLFSYNTECFDFWC